MCIACACMLCVCHASQPICLQGKVADSIHDLTHRRLSPFLPHPCMLHAQSIQLGSRPCRCLPGLLLCRSRRLHSSRFSADLGSRQGPGSLSRQGGTCSKQLRRMALLCRCCRFLQLQVRVKRRGMQDSGMQAGSSA